MQKQTKIFFGALLFLVLTLSLASAMSVKTIEADNFKPGSEQEITVEIKNNLDEDATDVSLTLNIPTGTPFSVVSSDDTKDIDSDDSENFDFKIKATNSAKAGDYQIPYTINYNTNETKEGTFTLTVEAEPKLVYSANVDTPVIGSKTKVIIKIVNKGLGDAKFVSLTILPSKYTLLSEDNSYIGEISSDDSQTENFEMIFNQQNPTILCQVEYRNFENELITETINLPVTVYTQEQALKLGIIASNNTMTYIIAFVFFIVGWIIIRKIRKKKRLNKAQGR
jgi:hypothetical protein